MFYVGQLSLQLRGKLKAFKDVELISGSEHFGLVARVDSDRKCQFSMICEAHIITVREPWNDYFNYYAFNMNNL